MDVEEEDWSHARKVEVEEEERWSWAYARKVEVEEEERWSWAHARKVKGEEEERWSWVLYEAAPMPLPDALDTVLVEFWSKRENLDAVQGWLPPTAADAPRSYHPPHHTTPYTIPQ